LPRNQPNYHPAGDTPLKQFPHKSRRHHAESAGALLVITTQIAIAAGAIVGGILIDGFGTIGAIAYAGFALLAGGLTILIRGPATAQHVWTRHF